MAKLHRRLGGVAALLGGLILIVFAVLHLPAVRGRVLDRVRGYAAREFDIALGASSLSYNVFTRSVELRDLSVASAAAAEPFLRADRLRVVFGPGIYLGRPAITRISLSRPRLTLIRETDGTVNLPSSDTGAPQRSPLQLGVVSVTALSMHLEDRLTRRSFTTGPFDFSVDTGASRHFGAFGPGGFILRAGQIETSGSIAGRLAFDGSRLRIDELTAETPEGRLALTGWADVTGEQPTVESRIDATVNLPNAARLVRLDVRGLQGHLDGAIDVSGALAAPGIAVTIKSRAASYAPIGGLELSGRASFSGSRAEIHSLSAKSTAGTVDVHGGIELGDTPSTGTPPSRVTLRWSNLRVDDLVEGIGYALPIRSGSSAMGSAIIDFDARELAWSRLRLSAETSLHALANASGPEFLALSGRADLRLHEGRWSLRHSIEAGASRADLTGEITGRLATGPGLRSTLGGRSRLRISDIGAALPPLQTAGVTPPALEHEGLSGSMLATVEPAGTTDKPRARIDLAVRDARARRLPSAGTLDARLEVDANFLQAHDVRANSGTTSLEASGKYGWRGSYEGRFELNQGELSDIVGRSGLPVTVGGAARLGGRISGTRGTGYAVASLSARDLVVEQVPIGLLDATARMTLADGGPITVTAAAPGLGARAQFEIVNRAGYPVSGEVTLEHQQIGALIPPRYRQQVGDVFGAVSANARGSGHLTDPAGIRGRIEVRQLDVMARSTRLVLAAPASVMLTQDRLDVASVDLRVGNSTRVTLDGQLGTAALPRPLRLRLEGSLSEVVDIGSRTAGLSPMPVRADGTTTLDLAVAGTFAHPLPSGHLAVRSSAIEYGSLAPMRNLTLDAAITPTLVTLRTLAAEWQGASIGGEGTLPWRVVVSSMSSPPDTATPSSHLARWMNVLPAEPARAKLTVRADNLTQAVLEDVLGRERLQEIQGAASAAVTIEADRLALERIEATAVLDRASLTLAGVPFVQRVPTRLRLENGRASIDAFRWSAGGNTMVAAGGVDLTAERPSMEFDISGAWDLRAVGAFFSGISSGGTADADLTVTGPVDSPDITGRITVADGELQLDTPRLAASDLTGTLQFAPGRQGAVSLVGTVNTGSSRLQGTFDLRDLAAPRGHLQFTARGIALEYPSGLQTESNAELGLVLDGAGSMLSGRIDVLGGTYREPLFLSSRLLNFSSTSGIARTAPPAAWLSRIGINVAVDTASDVRIDNNYGRLDIGASLRLVGTLANPGVLGRLQAADDGVIYLGGNTYRIERLEVDLPDPRALAPDVDFAAQTRVGDLPIGVELRCSAGGACERRVMSLATGVDDKEAEARLLGTGGAGSAGEGLARLLSAELLGVVGRTVGLDTIRLEQGAERSDIFDDPTLIAGEVNPATRLTLGKRVGSNVDLVYSQNLADDGFTWITSYTGPYGLSGRLLVLDDQSRRYEFRHEPPIGAGRTRQRPRPPGPRIAEVRIQVTAGVSEKQVRGHLRLDEGDRFTFGAWQRDRDRLERFYHSQGFLEARVRARRLPVDRATGSSDDTVALEYAITRGPSTRLVLLGATVPDEVRDSIVRRWTSALFDGFLERDARTLVRQHLYREGYLNAAVTSTVALDVSNNLKTLTIEVVAGSIMPRRAEMNGNAALPMGQLLEVANSGDPLAAWLDPAAVEQRIEDHYRSEGFLAADVSIGAPTGVHGTSVITITVVEGAPYSIGTLTLSGLPAGQDQRVRETLGLSAGERYRPLRVAERVELLETELRRQAYRQASVDVDTRLDSQAARVDVAIRVAPGPRSILQDVVVEGDDVAKSRVARSIVLEPGAPLDPAAIAETRRRLYDLDAYRSVEIDVQQAAPAPAPAPADAPLEQPVIARIALEERARYRFRYGLALNDEVVGADERDRRLGFAADVENRNVFGSGATAGVSVRLRRDQRVGRLTLGAKRLFALPIRSTLFVERERQLLDPEGAFPITSDISSLSAEQAYRIRPSIDLRYGYGLERNHTFIRSEAADAFDITVTVARFTTSGLVDRRDDAFNPARGWFTASTLELSTPGIGSDLKFLRSFAQYSHYVPIGRGLVLAGAARVGLARTFGDEVLIPSERFYAGGATTVRGYREDALGGQSVLGGAEGGSALLVLNGELRFPVYRWLKGVGFVDLGNVYPKVSDISFTDFQIGVGAGARFDTPLGLIRFDLGVPANRRSIDPHWRFHIGFGHVF